MIQDQLTDAVTGQLTSLLGGNQKQTQSAIGAAIPGLLSAFSGVASGGGKGADQLVKTLGGFDTGMLGDLAGMFTKSPEKVQSLGGGLLGNLLAGAVVSRLAGSIAKFTGMNAGMTTKLLGYLSPLVLGMIAKHFKSQNKPVTTQSINDLFKDQSGHIKKSLPAGFDLDDLLKGGTHSETRRAPEPQPAGPSLLKTLLPLAVIALLAFLAWQFLFPKNNAPPVDNNTGTNQVDVQTPAAQMPTQLAETYREARDAISGITDVASAEAALPRLNQLNEKLNGLALIWDKLPEQAREAVAAVTRNNFDELSGVIRPIMDIPGVTEKLRTVLTEILSKLQAFGGSA
jgi:hypothetical protein